MSSSDLLSLPVLRRYVPTEASGARIGPGLEAAMPFVCTIHHGGDCPLVWVPDFAALARMDGHWWVMESSKYSLPIVSIRELPRLPDATGRKLAACSRARVVRWRIVASARKLPCDQVERRVDVVELFDNPLLHEPHLALHGIVQIVEHPLRVLPLQGKVPLEQPEHRRRPAISEI